MGEEVQRTRTKQLSRSPRRCSTPSTLEHVQRAKASDGAMIYKQKQEVSKTTSGDKRRNETLISISLVAMEELILSFVEDCWYTISAATYIA